MLHRDTGFARSAKAVSILLGSQISPCTLALPQPDVGMKIIIDTTPALQLCKDGQGVLVSWAVRLGPSPESLQAGLGAA